MKNATLPPLRVDPELRAAVEDVLDEGETLSAFVLQSVRQQVARRRANREFLARGLASLAQAQASGRYVDAEEALGILDARIAQAAAKRKN